MINKRCGAVCLANALVLLVGLATAGCGGEEPSRTIDASVTVDLPDSVPAGSPFDIGYTWTPGQGFEAPNDDFRIFVHLVDPDGKIIVQDDHFPPLPTSQWSAGEPVEYRLDWVYLNPELQPDYVDVYVGIYDDEGQIATLREGRFQNRPLVHSVIVRTDDQGGIPVYVEGFEEREMLLTAEDVHAQQWRWMRRRGVVAFGNPRGPATLHLRALSPIHYLEGGTQTVTITVGETVIAQYEATASSPPLMRFEVPGEGLDDGDWVDFTIEVDKHFVPAQVMEGSDDIRELGLQVFWMYLGH
jgi:hypothetical protein